MSNFGTLREAILGCVSRAQSSFQAGSQNFADLAINNSIIFAQRNWDFQWLKGDVKIVCDPKGSMQQAVDHCGCPVRLKRIIKALGLKQPDGHNDREMPYLSRQSQIKDDSLGGKSVGTSVGCGCTGGCGGPGVRTIHDGECVYLSPQPGTVPYDLWFYAVKWLPRVVKDADTNFMFHYGFDFLMYRSIVELNFFIKEDERFQVSARMLQESWASFTAWDQTLVSPTETEIEL